ncbi:hypothetical protein EOL70_12865 [Leucothrix sargassi]|nr:hypothetical protein EOL70_12865 [Leucothrix sargassi]
MTTLNTLSTLLLAGTCAALVQGCAGSNAAEDTTKAPAAKTAATSTSSAELVEIKLVDKIDEDRGYCLDIAGGKGESAPTDKGLQAHTCYDYTGEILVDQQFDTALMKQDQFKIPYFNVCMAVGSLQTGAAIELASCNNAETQQFTLQANGQLVAKAKPELCVTVSATEKRSGRGGSPVHVMRPLSLETCSADQKTYQTWTTFKL